MNPEKQIELTEQLKQRYREFINEGYDRIYSKKQAIREIRAEFLDRDWHKDDVNEMIINAQKIK